MYKTVRHGENSLQYKILAQQEEGVASVKCRKAPRMVTAKLITVIILLVIGIIASAVLVPLVLTNDFITLTGTFQKFSVSTLRRSHSGNHVVVIAKKPYGWNGAHSSLPSRPSNTSRVHPNDFRKSTPATAPIDPSAATETTKTTAAEGFRTDATPRATGEKKQTERPTTETPAGSTAEGPELPKPSPTTSATFAKPWFGATSLVQLQKSFYGEGAEGERVSSTTEPVWFDPVKKWGFGSSDNFINGMNRVVTKPVLGSFLFVVVIVVMFFVLRKTLPKRRTLTEKERAESKEDKTRLLRPSSDHDEE